MNMNLLSFYVDVCMVLKDHSYPRTYVFFFLQGHPYLSDVGGLEYVVVDEADRMAEKGHYQELMHLMDRLAPLWGAATHQQTLSMDPNELMDADNVENVEKKNGEEVGKKMISVRKNIRTPKQRPMTAQEVRDGERRKRRRVLRMLFSATLSLPTSWKEKVRRTHGGYGGKAPEMQALVDRMWKSAGDHQDKPEVVDVTGNRRLAATLTQSYLECLETDRDAHLYYLLAVHPGRTLVFCNAVSAVRRVCALMTLLGVSATALHAQQQQRQRLKSLDKFAKGENAVLIATDVAARGLDIKGVRCVVHYKVIHA